MNCRGCLILGVVLLSSLLLACGITAMALGHFVVSTDALSSPADAIVVLGGDSGDLARVREAVRLFHEGYASTVVLVGGSLKDADQICSPGRRSLRAAEKHGLPTSAAIITYGARSTYDEAINLRRLASDNGWHSLIIVTDPFHTRRAGRTFRTLLPDLTIYVSAVPNPDYDAGHWWQTEDGLVAVFNEVIKLAFYWAQYGIAPIP